ncbi:uncharacterized protein LOC119828814 [Zerene cesonia]|uniref:uncharacterized protein LOC119828814 n=1 Tax=Zerene cesonia TaxID=33412 RepID=UPI0018E55216|nr:uncharacterized protein LOC119828814 [Zerene cesonia]
MSKRRLSKEMVAKNKNKVLACSTPEHRLDSPSRDSDSICDSDAGSPVPFLCTQDGAEGETDVVWNFYTPKAEQPTYRSKNTTPVSRKSRKVLRPKLIEKPLPRRKPVRSTQKRTELFQDLIELNQNLHELIKQKKSNNNVNKPQSGSEDDIFSDNSESSPKSGLRTSSRCLRKNVLSSKFKKQEPEPGLESDDSMNECLLRASQVVEENIINYDHSAPKRPCLEALNTNNKYHFKPSANINMDQDSMDTILSNIKLESPAAYNKNKKYDSPRLNNDSFDSLLGNLNDSALERLSQIPLKETKKNVTSTKDSSWILEDIIIHGESPTSRSLFGRHNSMPESPSMIELNKPSTSGTAFGRYNSMPFNKSDEKITVPGDSPIRCTQDEIKKKHQQARERLMAKRLLPFTTSQQQKTQGSSQNQPIQKKSIFQPKVPSITKGLLDNKINYVGTNHINTYNQSDQNKVDSSNVKQLIEKKRQEALMKLRRRQPQTKLP